MITGRPVVLESIELPYGASVEQTQAVQQRVLKLAQGLVAEHGSDPIKRRLFVQIGSRGPVFGRGRGRGGHRRRTPGERRQPTQNKPLRFENKPDVFENNRDRGLKTIGPGIPACCWPPGPNLADARNLLGR